MDRPELKHWRDYMIGEAGDLLLSAARRCLGPVRTPFNKHSLAAALEAWLKRPETLGAIAEGLNVLELRMLALVYWCGALPPGLVVVFMEDGNNATRRLASLALQQLQERLLVYSPKQGAEAGLLKLNPVVAPGLADILGLPALVAPSDGSSPLTLPVSVSARPLSLWQRSLVLVSVLMQERKLFRKNGLFVRSVRDALLALDPCAAPDAAAYLPLVDALQACAVLVRHDETMILPEPEIFLQLGRSFGNRGHYVILAAMTPMQYLGMSVPRCAALLELVSSHLPDSSLLSGSDLARLLLVAICRYRAVEEAERGPSLPAFQKSGTLQQRDLLEAVQRVLETLVLGGVVVPVTAGDSAPAADPDSGVSLSAWSAQRFRTVSGALRPPVMEKDPGGENVRPVASVVIEESFAVQALPEAAAEAQVWVAMMSRPQAVAAVWTGVIDKHAVLGAFGYGFTPERYLEEWRRFSGRELPQSLLFSLESWYREFCSVRLRKGIVVVLDAQLAWNLEHSRRSDELVREKLAEGVYLLNVRSLYEAERRLADFAIHTDLRGQANRDLSPEQRHAPPPRLTPADLFATDRSGAWPDSQLDRALLWPEAYAPDRHESRAKERERRVQARVADLLEKLDKLEYDDAVREIVACRIRNRLIIDDRQLKPRSGIVELSAGAMDYPGKARLLERSAKEQLPVELAWMEEGEKRSLTGLVRNLAKDGEGYSAEVAPLGTATDRLLLPVRLLSRVRLFLEI